VSTDGKTWSKPVAQVNGQAARADITFAPTRAKFVRITQTATPGAAAPDWAISSLRVYETPASAK
jgi:hypothetical protein